MPLIEKLLANSYEDMELLKKNDAMGDIFDSPRDVDFILLSRDESKANLVASFCSDNQYGRCRVDSINGAFRIVMTLNMPTNQHPQSAVSALMVCIAQLFEIEYDGWGCVLQHSSQM